MIPKHKSPKLDTPALAPYNFVSLPEIAPILSFDKLPDHDIYKKEFHSGFLECELETSSPIFTRAAQTLEQYKSSDTPPKDFFYISNTNDPVIPGSSLRGLFRSLYEIVTFSKIQFVTDKKMVFRAIGDQTSHGIAYRNRMMHEDNKKKYFTPLMRGGYIHKINKTGDWYIQPAKNINGSTYALVSDDHRTSKTLACYRGFKNCFECFLKLSYYDYQEVRDGLIHVKNIKALDISTSPQTGYQKSVLAQSGRMNSKKFEAAIFDEDRSTTPLFLNNDQIQAYRDQVSKKQESLLGNKDGVLIDGYPVFYILDKQNNVDFFGHCRMFRIPYKFSPKDLIPGSIQPSAKIDLTETLFGYTPSEKNMVSDQSPLKSKSYASRISFSDASVIKTKNNVRLLDNKKEVIPSLLSEPKPTTFQHYLTQNTPDRQVVGRTRGGKPKYIKFLSDYNQKENTTLRGSKFYWHKGEQSLSDISLKNSNQVNDSQKTIIKPLIKGVSFKFAIRFENLFNLELGALLWILSIASNSNYRLSLGMGKPHGMGAISIKSKLFLSDRVRRYSTLFESNKAFTTQDIESPTEKVEVFISQFENTICKSIKHENKQFSELERIKELLALLSWFGPDSIKTRYLDIEHPDKDSRHGKINEYRERPVLPNSTDVV